MTEYLFIFTTDGGFQFEEIGRLFQEELADDEVVLLDVFSEVFVWKGSAVSTNIWDKMFPMLEFYFDGGITERSIRNTTIVTLSQNFEPAIFFAHFPHWNPPATRETYEGLLKKVRDENVSLQRKEKMV